MKRLIVYISLLLITQITFGQRQKFQINGAARGYMFANELDISKDVDSVTVRKENYGHTLLDLGVSVFPNDKTEVIGMFRIRNEMGGFWGGGVTFDVRQLSLKGVAGDLVRYELGDIDVKMTPYTLYNFEEEGSVNEADAFALRRDIVRYDMFYNDDNSWRMQGAQIDFGLELAKGIEQVNFKGFLTRQRTTDGISQPERLYGGGTVELVQSKNLKVGLNNINLFDLTYTTTDSIRFNNSVNTVNWKYNYELNDKIDLGFKGEGGISYAEYRNDFSLSSPGKYDDTFIDAALMAELKDLGVDVSLGFKDVGPDFMSAGAQTKRIDFGGFPALYGQITHNQIGRPATYFDFLSFNTENNYKISETLMEYNMAYNNSNPYGVATPNRRGLYLNATRKDSIKFTESFFNFSLLNDIRGSGTFQKKTFMVAEAGTDVFINDFIGWDKWIKLDLGVRFENTSRGGEFYEEVDLTSMLIDAGLSLEFLENFDLLVGAKLWSVNGNEYYIIRNRYNTVTDFTAVDYNFNENTYAAGLRYRFSNETSLSAQYQTFMLNDKSNNSVDYNINQFNILYNMFF